MPSEAPWPASSDTAAQASPTRVTRPRLQAGHLDLRHLVVVHLLVWWAGGQRLGCDPPELGVLVAHRGPRIGGQARVRAGVDGEHGDPAVAQPVEAHLPVHGVGQAPLVLDLGVDGRVVEQVRRGVEPEVAQVLQLLAEDQCAHGGVDAVGADAQVRPEISSGNVPSAPQARRGRRPEPPDRHDGPVRLRGRTDAPGEDTYSRAALLVDHDVEPPPPDDTHCRGERDRRVSG
jgi:hypothetical protein